MAGSTQILRLNTHSTLSKLDEILIKKKESSVLRKIKSEYVIRDRISNKIFDDIEAVKTAYDIMYPPAGANLIKGIIQTISQNPFGFVFLSKIQVKIYFRLCFFIFIKLTKNFLNIRLISGRFFEKNMIFGILMLLAYFCLA